MMNIKLRQPFQHRENYGVFNSLLDNNGFMTIRTDEINKITYDQYFQWLLNFMIDGIEHPIWHGAGKIEVIFSGGVSCVLTINDFLINMILWYIPVETEVPITCDFLYWEEYLTNRSIAKYINRCFVNRNRGVLTNIYMNNVIADCTNRFSIIDKISKYLSDSINFYDDIQLMKKCPEYYDCLHLDVSRQPIDKVKGVINKTIDKAVDIIEHSKQYLGYYHSLASNFMSGEALNKKQFGETYIAIGTKPDPYGGVFPYIISNSFINGGVTDDVSRFIESAGGRKATILSHKNVSDSGTLATKAGLNNQNTFLNKNPNYCCNTRNPVKIFISNEDTLQRFNLRYARMTPFGAKRKIHDTDKDLIGKYIYLYSPMTCASYANGQGICYQCYGDLAYINNNINIGVFAANELSNEFTQRLLSAKHILETIITVVKWSEGFDDYFTVETDQIYFNDNKANTGVKIIININNIQEDDEDDEDDYSDDNDFDDDTDFGGNESNYYLTEFAVYDPKTEETVLITSEDSNKMYLTKEMYNIISKQIKKTDDDVIEIDVSDIDFNMFTLDINNSELNKTLNDIQNLIDKVSITSTMTKEEFLQKFIESLNGVKIKMNSVHCEIILANQIRSKSDILNRPAWEYDNPDYQILSLRQSLASNPSPLISLSYQDVPNQLNANTLTYRKSSPSIYDLNILKKPQEFMENMPIEKSAEDTGYQMSVLGVDNDVNQTPKFIDPFVIKTNKK